MLLFLGEIYALRREREEMERFLALAAAAAPGDPEIEGSAWAGGRGMLALLDDDRAGASRLSAAVSPSWTRCRSKGRRPTGACGRCCWPPAATRAPAAAVAEARRLGMTVNRANRGLLGYAEAILAGRDGDRRRADRGGQGG